MRARYNNMTHIEASTSPLMEDSVDPLEAQEFIVKKFCIYTAL